MDNLQELEWHMTGTPQEVSDILIQFAQQLRDGDITVWKAQQELHIRSDKQILLAVKADASGDGCADLRVEMKWGQA